MTKFKSQVLHCHLCTKNENLCSFLQTTIIHLNYYFESISVRPWLPAESDFWSVSPDIIRQSSIRYTGSLGRWDKRLIDQGLMLQALFFIIISYRLRATKTLGQIRQS